MIQMLAQGGGGGGWGGLLNPAFIKVAIYVIFGLFVLLGGVFKKINERNAKRAAELARERRRDEMLRTGRDESGAFVDVTRAAALDAPAPAQTTDAEEAKARLQALAERRRRELQEMMKRAAGGAQGGVGASRPGPQVRPQQTLPQVLGPQAQRPPTQPARPQRPNRKQQEQQARRLREQQEKAARREAREERGASPQSIASTLGSGTTEAASGMPASTAYQQPTAPSPGTVRGASANVGAAMARVMGAPGAQPTTAAEWRKAIVLNELLNPPVSMR